MVFSVKKILTCKTIVIKTNQNMILNRLLSNIIKLIKTIYKVTFNLKY